MFKKKKDKKREEPASKNTKNLAKKKSKSPPPDRELSDNLDDTDGFDENGFVDLQPIESDATLLGPKQKCKYVGTFGVISGTDGEKTLKTHKERTSYVKYHISEYRNKSSGVDVILRTSSDGIKVFSSDGKRVRMAYALQRITFATCDPDFKLYSFMTNSPSPVGVAVHGHVFKGHSSTQVQELTAMIGRAFKLAFASAKLQKNPRYNTGDLVSSPHKPARRWAKHEAVRGHDLSEHAEKAKDRKKDTKVTRSDSPVSQTDSSPVLKKKAKGGWRGGNSSSPSSLRPLIDASILQSVGDQDDLVCDSISSMSISSSSTVFENSTKTEKSETITSVSETHVSREIESMTSSVNPAPLPYSSHKVLTPTAPSGQQSSGVPPETNTTPLPPLPPRSYTKERPVTQYLMDAPTPVTDVVTADEATADKVPADKVPADKVPADKVPADKVPADKVPADKVPADKVPSASEDQKGGTEGANNDYVVQEVKVTYAGTDSAASNSTGNEQMESADRVATHQHAYWYMPGIPREFIMDMLQTSEEGSFFVRTSQSRKGCHALTVRVPTEFQAGGYGNYLITPEPEGVKLEGFAKVFADITSLINHYSQHADELPCKLLLTGSSTPSDDSEEEEDYTDFEPVDPDYRLLSDFHSMMDEFNQAMAEK